jgi:hypothetical protein
MSGAVFTLGNSVSGSLGLGDAISKLGRVAVTGLTIEQDPDTVNSYLTTRYAGLSAVTSGGVTTFLNPSLVIIPSAYNNGIVYSLHSRQVNTGDFTVTRNTEARRVNSAGRIASIGSGLPRLDYLTSGGTVGTPALLVEPAGTNFARGVELLNTPTPVTASGGITITTGSTDFLAPDGSSATITKYVGGTASGSNFIEYVSSTSVSASGVHTFSAFVKAGATNPLNFCALQFTAYTDASGTGISYFNLASGTALTAGATIQNYGNGWYRIISAPYTIAAGDLAGSIRLLFAEADNDVNWPASGALNLTVYAWGIQLEAGSVATSYISTTTGTGSRSTDIISVSGAVSGSIGQTEGTIYAEVDIRNVGLGEGSIVTLFQASNNYIEILRGTLNRIQASIADSAGSTALTTTTSFITANSIYKIALGYKSGEFALYVNGTQVATSSAARTIGGLTTVRLGSYSTSFIFNDRIRAAALYTTRLTNQQLQLLTTL